MTMDVYRFVFGPQVPLVEAEGTLQLATIALEGLMGQAQVRLDAAYHLDRPRRQISVDGTTLVGAALVRVFTGLLIREFGEDAFQVRRAKPCPPAAPAPPAPDHRPGARALDESRKPEVAGSGSPGPNPDLAVTEAQEATYV